MTSRDKQPPIDEELMLRAAQSTLEHNIDEMDEKTLAGLYSARRNAVAAYSAKQSQKHQASRWVLPLAGLATVGAAVLVAVTLWTLQPAQRYEGESNPVAGLEDINLLTGTEDIEFYQDLEFYEWLAVNEQVVS